MSKQYIFTCKDKKTLFYFKIVKFITAYLFCHFFQCYVVNLKHFILLYILTLFYVI